jgi:hypothetical protein
MMATTGHQGIDLVMMPLQKLHDEPTEFRIVFDE